MSLTSNFPLGADWLFFCRVKAEGWVLKEKSGSFVERAIEGRFAGGEEQTMGGE